VRRLQHARREFIPSTPGIDKGKRTRKAQLNSLAKILNRYEPNTLPTAEQKAAWRGEL